jgi:N6-adenosine-specific RNA methylase IME4
MPYASMSIEEIRQLPVQKLADPDCRLFLWTTNRFLPHAFEVMAAWGFRYRQTLVWHKRTMNLPAHIAPNSAEFLLVGVIGKPARLTPLPTAVIATTRGGTDPQHSQKPECFLDYVEQASPGPYLEMFARRKRFGWHVWGDEVESDLELVA